MAFLTKNLQYLYKYFLSESKQKYFVGTRLCVMTKAIRILRDFTKKVVTFVLFNGFYGNHTIQPIINGRLKMALCPLFLEPHYPNWDKT